MKVSDFDFFLPEDQIAQEPVEPRDSSRLLVLHRDDGLVEHRIFRDVIDYLGAGDVLVINDTKVIPARLFGIKEGSGKGAVEVLLLKQLGIDLWECLVKPGRKFQVGSVLIFGDGLLKAEVTQVTSGGERILSFSSAIGVNEAIHRLGQMPLPPYITRQLADPGRYQTVYAREEGSAAAPTAGLHFTPELLESIRTKGIKLAPVTLHVGLGTFRPVKVENILEHEMHSEYYEITPASASVINGASDGGGRVVCVGTTSVRVLESAADEGGRISPCKGWTSIFIYPGYRFKIVNALITNFHLPKSTLLMLVSAMAGRERILEAYREAVNMKYRFFSFGDAMFII